MSASQDRAWNLFQGARIVYVAHPSLKNRMRVQVSFRAFAEAMGLTPDDVETAEAVMNERNGWAALPKDAAA